MEKQIHKADEFLQRKGKIEILAPAGSYESFQAAIQSGADAVYAGGAKFGARALAENFTLQELLQAIDEAHLHGRRFYLTVNTLLKDAEIPELYQFLEPLYCGGLDAVIVQDLGVLSFIRKYFSDLEIHASTQMTVVNAKGARFLKEQGVKRVVPSRELSLPEIKEIRSQTGLDVECFVHGALCYCYSGQCLLSSFIGGRSGNRGQCAQPCRLFYTANGQKGYLLSLKDICTLRLIPEMAEAGINSFKIEGRMKKPQYVALVTAIYRKYLDQYVLYGREAFEIDPADIEALQDIYNRGGFHTGYYRKYNGREMISLNRPNHAGVPALSVLGQKGREVTGIALTELHKGDVLELDEKRHNYTSGKELKKGESMRFLAPKNQFYKKGTVLNRVRNQKLLDEIEKNCLVRKKQEKIYGFLRLLIGKPATLVVYLGTVKISVQTEVPVTAAYTRPLERAVVQRQIGQTGDTDFVFDELKIDMEEGAFLPVQQIKQLRRRAIEELKKAVARKYKRETPEKVPDFEKEWENSQCKVPGTSGHQSRITLCVLITTAEQLTGLFTYMTKNHHTIQKVYVDFGISGGILPGEEILDLCRKIKERGAEIFLAMPHILRDKALGYLEEHYQMFYDSSMDGVLVRNLEGIEFLKEHKFDKQMILDHNLYIFNLYGKTFFRSLGFSKFTAPLELNRTELIKLGLESAEMVIYGHLPVMISTQCIARTTGKCKKSSKVLTLKDRYGHAFPVRSYCTLCYNVIYNTSAIYLADRREELLQTKAECLRLQFTIENREQMQEILTSVETELSGAAKETFDGGQFTRGHFTRGIL